MAVGLAEARRGGPDLPRVHTDHETGQTIIAGMGELHLEIIVDRLLSRVQGRRQRGQASGCLPRDLRVTPSMNAEGKFVRQSGGRGQYGHAVIDIVPATRRARATSSRTPSSAAWCPKEYIPSIDKGIQEALDTGVLAGYPVDDVQGQADRRFLPRRRLLRGRLQGGRFHGHQGRPQEVRPGHARARRWRSRLRPPSSTRATSWATCPPAAA